MTDDTAVQHDLIFYANRNTPKVVSRGGTVQAKAGYGKVVKRRKATAEEEKTISRGDWVRVDKHGNKPGDGKYRGGSNYRPQLRNMSKADAAGDLTANDDHPLLAAWTEIAAFFTVCDAEEKAAVLASLKAVTVALSLDQADAGAPVQVMHCPPCERVFSSDQGFASHIVTVHSILTR